MCIRDRVKGTGSIDTEIAQFALEALNIDKYGLDEIDNKILCTIIDKFKGGEDGYHEVRMIMQTVGLYDKIDLYLKEKMCIRDRNRRD